MLFTDCLLKLLGVPDSILDNISFSVLKDMSRFRFGELETSTFRTYITCAETVATQNCFKNKFPVCRVVPNKHFSPSLSKDVNSYKHTHTHTRVRARV